MKKISLILLLVISNTLQTLQVLALPENTETTSQDSVEQAGSSETPESSEESPFLIERENAKKAAAKAANSNISINRLYPPRHSISRQIANFFKHLFGIMESSLSRTPLLHVTVEPNHFSIATNSELRVTLKITNDKQEMIMLHFTTNQRLEIVVKDDRGEILSRWSQDRSFDPTDDTVVINPQESILYTEKIATAGMQDGRSYTLEVSLVNQPEYVATQTVSPHALSENQCNQKTTKK